MSQSDLRTHEVDDDSSEHPVTPHPPVIRRVALSGVIAALLLVALGVSTFAALSAYRAPHAAAGATPTFGRMPAVTPTLAAPSGPAVKRGKGLPEGVEIVTFMLTGTDEGWATGAVVTNPVTGFPDRSMVYHYAAGTWTQAGAALLQTRLGGLDMLSSSEGWAWGIDANNTPIFLHISNGAWQRAPEPVPSSPGADLLVMRTPHEGWLTTANLKSAYSGASSTLYHLRNGYWSQVRGAPYYITDIVAVAANEAWVIGWQHDGTSALVHVLNGVATLELTGTSHTSFFHLRMFAPNDIWIEGAMHDSTNVGTGDLPLNYHYDGAAWANVNLQAPGSAQHIDIVAPDVAWALLSKQPPPGVMGPTDGEIAALYSLAGGQWNASGLPYTDLQSLEALSSSPTDVWALGVYWTFQQIPSDNGGQSFAGITHNVLLHYNGGAWTEYGR
ncbi:MAG TPA: hypothetical protein VF808_05475 [Ktedonobacterales bacterium]